MSKFVPILCIYILTITLGGCTIKPEATITSDTFTVDTTFKQVGPEVKALLASRYRDLDELRNLVSIKYYNQPEPKDSSRPDSRVELIYRENDRFIKSILRAGVSQKDFIKGRDGGLGAKLGLLVKTPYAVQNREDLNKVYKLSRRRPAYFGEGDVAFFDLAEHSVKHINTPELAFLTERDSSEKGFLNTFNHVTAQALITTLFSEELADFVAVVHERHNMPELIVGRFTPEQLADPNNNPVDNYVDIINNEIGQVLGNHLRRKYQISSDTRWTPELLCNYLNDLQEYYSWSFGIGFTPFEAEDEVVRRFVAKLEIAAQGLPFKEEL